MILATIFRDVLFDKTFNSNTILKYICISVVANQKTVKKKTRVCCKLREGFFP